MKVLLETSPLRNANSIRGVGVYTRFLSQELEKLSNSQDQYITQEDIGMDQLSAMMQKRGIDILHYPYFKLFQQTLPLPFVNRFLGRSTQKIVVTIHDVIPLLFPEHYPVGIAGTVGLFLQKQALQGVSAVITDSQTSKTDITKYLNVSPDKITSIPLAGNPDIKPVSAQILNQVKQKLQLPETYILYVGDINYNKNIPELLKALAVLPPSVHLVCVGANFRPQPIPEWKAIEQLLPNIKNRVHFLTDISKDDTQTLSAIYCGAAMYVQPSLYEGFGLPLLEAMQCDTLLVSSDTPALKEIGGEGTEFVSPTAQGLSAGIQKMLSLSSSEKASRVEKNRQQLQNFSWAKAAKETVQVYKSVL